MSHQPTRREFVTLAAAAGLSRWADAPDGPPAGQESHVGPIVVFQGDSITDTGRNRSITAPNVASALGNGYPLLVAAALLESRPERRLQFFNRGVGGDKVPDLRARWDADTLALKPDVLSVLVGVNDFWHKLSLGYTGTIAEYETGLGSLLDGTRRALPRVRLLVLEPFVLRTGAVDAAWFPEFDERRAAAARVAASVGALFVPLQAEFDKLTARAGPQYWTMDGVHPTPAGHSVIAGRWRDAAGL